jgi:hypothetical protein
MSSQNSAVVYQIRPDMLSEELGIKKDSYYTYMKVLGLKAEKDHEGKAYLSEEQANLMRALRQHVLTTGKIEGFVNSNGETVAVVEVPNGEAAVEPAAPEQPVPEVVAALPSLEAVEQVGQEQTGQLAIAEESALDAPTAETLQEEPVQPGMEDELIRMAAELKTQQLVMMPMVVQELASRMSYEDLPEDMRAQVDRVRAAAAPKFQPAEVAGNILERWRDRNQQQQVTAA